MSAPHVKEIWKLKILMYLKIYLIKLLNFWVFISDFVPCVLKET
jgi:hypothetical protein